MTAPTVGDSNGATEVNGEERQPTRRSVRVLAVVALAAAVLWLGGLGSVIAIVLAAIGLRSRPKHRLDRRLLQVALALGIVGLLVTAVSFGMLASSTSTST